MTRITEVHRATRQVDAADEHRHKHTLVIILRESRIHTRGNLCRHHVLRGQRTEQTRGLCHEE